MRITLPRWVSLTIKGAGYLEGYGAHPGLPAFLVFVAFGAISGAVHAGPIGAAAGVLMMLAWLGPLYLIGCYDRAAGHERATLKELIEERHDDEA